VEEGTGLRRGSSSYRVYRGGSFESAAGYVRSANRNWHYPEGRGSRLGFRPSRSLGF